MKQHYDAIIVGTGAAGLFCALNLPQSMQIALITKARADQSDSYLAQGGICMLRGEEDYENYFEDTMRAGHYENNEKTVDLMIRSSNAIIRELIGYGVDFARDENGHLAFTKEGAHSQPRILFHEDETGKEITSTLLDQVKKRSNIELKEYCTMLDLIEADNQIQGIVVIENNGVPYTMYADSVVLACGGLGGLYENSTNFPHITGDALALAIKHHVEVEHLDYVQIHPTTLYSTKPGRRFLISESVRGEGALLLDKNGNRFVQELLPRDVVSKAIWAQMEKDGTKHVWLDMRPLGEKMIQEHFPNIYQHCLDEGYDPLKTPVPVVPAQHYFMGGIKVDLASRTSMAGLYAIGETSCNGVHGKNRLASNSLLESLVFAQRAADDILFGKQPAKANDGFVDLSAYSNLDALFEDYADTVKKEMKRMELEHE
jgi:L-aspartate oxidase